MQASEKFTYTNWYGSSLPSRSRASTRARCISSTLKSSPKVRCSRGPRGDLRGPGAARWLAAIAPPDMQGWTIWETLANTIEAEELTL